MHARMATTFEIERRDVKHFNMLNKSVDAVRDIIDDDSITREEAEKRMAERWGRKEIRGIIEDDTITREEARKLISQVDMFQTPAFH